MQFSESIFAMRFNITRQDLEGYLAEALSHGGITRTSISNTC